MNTKKEIVDKTYYILGEDQSSTVFDKEGTVVPKINTTIDKICRCNVTNILTWEKIRWGILDFLYEERTLSIPRAKNTIEDIDVNSKSIKLDTLDWLPTNWFIEINGNVIWYSWLDTTNNAVIQLAWVNGKHEWGSVVHFAHLLPENIVKAADFYDVDYEDMLKFIDFREKRIDWERCYTLKPYKWRKVAIFYNIESPVTISYTKKLEPLERDEDECWLPENFWVEILPYIVAGSLLVDTSEQEKAKALLNQWYSALEDMYSYYATPTKKFRKKIKTTPLNNNLR